MGLGEKKISSLKAGPGGWQGGLWPGKRRKTGAWRGAPWEEDGGRGLGENSGRSTP